MKATYTRPFPHRSRFLGPKLPSQEDLANTLGIVLALMLVIATAWAIFPEPNSAVPMEPETGLELALSGVVASTATLSPDELQTVQCSAAGFQVASTQTTAFPLTMRFDAPAGASSTFYTLGSNSALALNIDGATYTLLSGAVTTSPGVYTFNASFVDAQGQPLQLSGRLSCPQSSFRSSL